jgi:hypothetical protein
MNTKLIDKLTKDLNDLLNEIRENTKDFRSNPSELQRIKLAETIKIQNETAVAYSQMLANLQKSDLT